MTWRARLLPPLFIGLAVAAGYALRFGAWQRVWHLALAGAFTAWLAWLQRGRWRDSAVSLTAIFLGLAAVEAVAIQGWGPSQGETRETNTPGHSRSHPVLGWGQGAPGAYHHIKRHADGRLIFDATYTIGPDGFRVVQSAANGPVIAFLGDSTTYGTGLNDADTLPQAFADLTARRFTVRNLAMSGYGPNQILRALETGAYDAQLQNTRLIIVQTDPFHAERASCWLGFMLRAPRYVLENGRPQHTGPCYANPWVAVRSVILASATWRHFVAPALGGPSRAEMDLYIAMLIEAGRLARDRYAAPLVIMNKQTPDVVLTNANMTKTDIESRLRAGGLIVVDGSLERDAPGHNGGVQTRIPGDGHPTAAANQIRATLLHEALRRQFLD